MGAQAELVNRGCHPKLNVTAGGVMVQVTIACSPKDADTAVVQVMRQDRRRLVDRGVELV